MPPAICRERNPRPRGGGEWWHPEKSDILSISSPLPVPRRRWTGVRVLRYDGGWAAIGSVHCDEQTVSMKSDPVSGLPHPVSRILFCPPRRSPDTPA